MQYRRDIDGLRGLAVLSVLAYHVGISAARGGFLGVDVFFVISGYLITGQVAKAAAADNLNFALFWIGRLRRLWPALAVTLIASGVCALALLYPSELQQFAWSAVAAAFGVSNVYYYFNTDYFQATMTGTSVLLHTWTLGVEAQFYVLLPIVLALQARAKRPALLPLLAALGCLSLALSFLAPMNQPAAFYLLPARIWEFLVGSILAIWPRLTRPPGPRTADAAGVVGIIAIVASVWLADEHFPIIGAVALAPCLGAAAIIWAGQNPASGTARIMGLPPLAGLGKISYSVYLWHWPIIVFLNAIYVPLNNRPALKLGVMGVSIVAGYLSWRFIELPFRYGPRRPSNAALLQASALVAGLILISGVGLVASGGAPGRFLPSANNMQAFLSYNPSMPYRQGSCYVTSGTADDYDRANCLKWDDNRPNVLLLGDSHAAHLWYGLNQAFPEANIMQATSSGCRPLYDEDPPGASLCKRLIKSIYDDYLGDHKLEALILAGRWQKEDLSGLEGTLDWAKRNGVPVILIGPIVEYDTPLPRLLAAALQRNDSAFVARHQSEKAQMIDRQLALLAARRGVRYVSLWKAMCPHGQCVETDDAGRPIQFDYGHLTRNGSAIVGALIRSTGKVSFDRTGLEASASHLSMQDQDGPQRSSGAGRIQ